MQILKIKAVVPGESCKILFGWRRWLFQSPFSNRIVYRIGYGTAPWTKRECRLWWYRFLKWAFWVPIFNLKMTSIWDKYTPCWNNNSNNKSNHDDYFLLDWFIVFVDEKHFCTLKELEYSKSVAQLFLSRQCIELLPPQSQSIALEYCLLLLSFPLFKSSQF